MAQSRHPYQTKNTDEMAHLVSLVDEHLQYQYLPQHRRDSQGTMFLDYDDITGTHVARYRSETKPSTVSAAIPERRPIPAAMPKRRPVQAQAGPRQGNSRADSVMDAMSSSSSSASASSGQRRANAASVPQPTPSLPKVYHAPNGGVYIQGNDQRTRFEWDYDGRTFHVHRDAVQPPSGYSPVASAYSEYYAIDARHYAPDAPVFLVDKELPHLPQKQRRKREKVSKFIQETIDRLYCCNALKLFRDECRIRKEKREFVRGNSWVHSGYAT